MQSLAQLAATPRWEEDRQNGEEGALTDGEDILVSVKRLSEGDDLASE
jgi:hypothetical protein